MSGWRSLWPQPGRCPTSQHLGSCRLALALQPVGSWAASVSSHSSPSRAGSIPSESAALAAPNPPCHTAHPGTCRVCVRFGL